MRVATPSITLDPAEESIQFEIVGGDDLDAFHIDPSNGTVYAVKVLDREMAAKHEFVVRAEVFWDSCIGDSGSQCCGR